MGGSFTSVGEDRRIVGWHFYFPGEDLRGSFTSRGEDMRIFGWQFYLRGEDMRIFGWQFYLRGGFACQFYLPAGGSEDIWVAVLPPGGNELRG